MLTRRFAVALTLLTCLAGCAGNNVSPSADSGSSATSATSAGPSAASAPSPEPSDSAATESLTGTVEAGVEPNCRLIKDDAGSHVLFFDDPSLKTEAPVGKKVTVTGHSKPGMMTTCQQGKPFIVTAVSPA